MMILPSEMKEGTTMANAQGFADVRPNGRIYSRLKRALDILSSGIGLIILLPIFLLVAIAIKIDSRGPILYAQERVGKNRRRRPRRAADPASGPRPGAPDRRKTDCYGRVFEIYKFRSMVADAEKHTGPVWATQKDARVTRVGKVLRKTRLDETPQLWNVLRGDMSLVGPRPERPNFVISLARTLPDYPARCQALPGVTGLAQVKWRYDTSIETVNRKLQYDLYYLRYGRLLLDLKIMAATLRVVVRGDGAL
ncbi:MAG TPA: sugar transferase [Candidatus Omnitrophota bacterium]|jgi:lipopolysaccharide/colanic/teichoic acid biosynthesis glycosyltransferase|nr:sugar transferase [Candidatus Omnitrophota bacterium]